MKILIYVKSTREIRTSNQMIRMRIFYLVILQSVIQLSFVSCKRWYGWGKFLLQPCSGLPMNNCCHFWVDIRCINLDHPIQIMILLWGLFILMQNFFNFGHQF